MCSLSPSYYHDFHSDCRKITDAVNASIEGYAGNFIIKQTLNTT